MPIYEYKCVECEGTVEVLQKVDEPPPAKCPHCETEGSLKKQVALSSFQLQGKGWERDSYQ